MNNDNIKRLEIYIQNRMYQYNNSIINTKHSIIMHKILIIIVVCLGIASIYFSTKGAFDETNSISIVIILSWFLLICFSYIIIKTIVYIDELYSKIEQLKENYYYYVSFNKFFKAYMNLNYNLYQEILKLEAKDIYEKYKEDYEEELKRWLINGIPSSQQ